MNPPDTERYKDEVLERRRKVSSWRGCRSNRDWPCRQSVAIVKADRVGKSRGADRDEAGFRHVAIGHVVGGLRHDRLDYSIESDWQTSLHRSPGSGLEQGFRGTPHETEIYVRLQRVDVMFSIVYLDSDNELHPVQERRILYLDLADYERLR